MPIQFENIHYNELFDLQLDLSITQTVCSGTGAVVGIKVYKRYNGGSWALEHQVGFEADQQQDGSNWSISGEELKQILDLEFDEVLDLKIEAQSVGFNIAQVWVKAIYNDQDKFPEPQNVPVGGLRIKEVIQL